MSFHRVITGDCLAVLKTLDAGSIDAVVTDPPYGIGERWDKPQIGRNGRSRLWTGEDQWDFETQDEAVAQSLAMCKKAIVWGGNYYDLPPSRGYLIWDKMQKFSNADSEYAWCSWAQTPRTFRYSRGELANEGKYHPTQKPLPLMMWCLSFLPEGCTILDPFCGSGTTGVACKLTGRNFIGIEINEGYANIARRRIADAASLFHQPEREADPLLIGATP